MKIRLTNQNDACFETALVTYPHAGPLSPQRNLSSSRIERCDQPHDGEQRRDTFGTRLLALCCDCLAEMMEMNVGTKHRSQQRSLDRIRDDQSWARLDSEGSIPYVSGPHPPR
jgi:hypothetical protein